MPVLLDVKASQRALEGHGDLTCPVAVPTDQAIPNSPGRRVHSPANLFLLLPVAGPAEDQILASLGRPLVLAAAGRLMDTRGASRDMRLPRAGDVRGVHVTSPAAEQRIQG